jgi:hypothetical protein
MGHPNGLGLGYVHAFWERVKHPFYIYLFVYINKKIYIQKVFGSIFCDFGKEFVVGDSTGEQIATAMIAGISRCVYI